MLVYGEEGSDPLKEGALARNQRIMSCEIVATICASEGTRRELRANNERRQSLQIRVLNSRDNPLLGGVEWSGRSPERVRIVCDLDAAQPIEACAVIGAVT